MNNLGTATATVTISLMDKDGTAVGSLSYMGFAPAGQLFRMISDNALKITFPIHFDRSLN